MENGIIKKIELIRYNMKRVLEKLKSQLPPYSPPGCFIATAVYPSNCYKLQTFRNFRDKVLLRYKIGENFVYSYYRISPRIADYIKRKKFFKKLTLYLLIEPVYRLLKFLFR